MFIHGENDKLVPYSMLDVLNNSAVCEKKKLSIKNAGHIESYVVEEEKYWREVAEFIEKY